MRIELTKEQRIKWFFKNYYETGMELNILIDSLKDKDLEKGIDWIGENVKLPKYLDEFESPYINIIRGKQGELLYSTKKVSDSDKKEIKSKGLYIDKIKLI